MTKRDEAHPVTLEDVACFLEEQAEEYLRWGGVGRESGEWCLAAAAVVRQAVQP